ncbi:putative F-box protein At2g33200 isoform X2 [Magnolia sinica]|nr:putative F-box protein At2g33200 isoform X2 [Magnolia sinica]XP_058115444.1 putative F-box protein At2g33200 isoform X2 [Magnolia sinica]
MKSRAKKKQTCKRLLNMKPCMYKKNSRQVLTKIKEKMRKEKTIEEEYGDVMIYRWSDLHQPLLELILRHLPLPDRRMFSSVCRSWHEAEKQCLHPPPPQLPWIMLQTYYSRKTHRFFSLSENRVYDIKLPRMSDKRYLASCGAWLLAEDDNSDKHFLINPFSKERIRLPHCKDFFCDGGILTSPPTNPDCLVLLHHSKSLRILHLGRDSSWRSQSLMNNHYYLPFIYLKGKLYSLNHWSELVVIDLLPYPKERLVELDDGQLPPLEDCFQEVLVESCGEILLVIVTTHVDESVKFLECLYLFEVFKLDWDVMAWVKVESLGDRMLFLTHQGSISVSAAKTGGKGNHIYYIPTGRKYFIEFNLGSRIPATCSIPDPHYMNRPFWVTTM